jgi:hypothetical protein
MCAHIYLRLLAKWTIANPREWTKKAASRARPHFHNLYDTEQRSPFINSFLAAKQKYENVHLWLTRPKSVLRTAPLMCAGIIYVFQRAA